MEQWVSDGGDKVVDFPISVTGLIVEMNRSPLVLTDFQDAEPSVRIKDIRALYESAVPQQGQFVSIK